MRDLTRNLVLLKTVNHKISQIFSEKGKEKGEKKGGGKRKEKEKSKGKGEPGNSGKKVRVGKGES